LTLRRLILNVPLTFLAKIERKLFTTYIVFNQSIENDVHDDTSGDYRSLLKGLLAAEREENVVVNNEDAIVDARALLKAGAEKIGTDEDVFIRILTTKSLPQLRATFDHYDKVPSFFPLSF